MSDAREDWEALSREAWESRRDAYREFVRVLAENPPELLPEVARQIHRQVEREAWVDAVRRCKHGYTAPCGTCGDLFLPNDDRFWWCQTLNEPVAHFVGWRSE